MARPTLTDVEHGQQSWDSTINDNNAVIQGGPFPVVVYATPGDLPAAGADNVNCVAATTTPKELWMSDGSAWRTYGTGHVNANGARGGPRLATAVIDVAVSPTAAGIFPAGCVRKGVSGRVETLLVLGGGGVSVNVGDGSDADRYKAALGLTVGLSFTPADVTATALEQLAAAGDVTLSPDAGTFTSGTVRVVVAYDELTAPTA